MVKLCLIPILVLCLLGCHDHSPHGHSHDEPAAQNEHADQKDHAHEEPAAHTEHADHAPEAVQITLWDDEVELFIEYPPVVVGVPTKFVTHVTHVDQWRARTAGSIQLVLKMAGETSIEINDPAPARDGIYLPMITFPKPGRWDVEVRVPLEGKVNSQTIPGLIVYATEAEMMNQPSGEESEGISFLKEQQWKMPFASETVTEQPFRASLRSNGLIVPHAAGEVKILGPVSGRIPATASGVPHIGAVVQKGQKLVSLIPRLNTADDAASLTLSQQKAELAHKFAQEELSRLKGLYDLEAIPKNRLALAELNLQTALAERNSANDRLRNYTAAQKETGNQGLAQIDLFSPLSGSVIAANVVPGALVAEGDQLFHVIDLTKVWLKVQIAEGDIGKVGEASGAWFTVEGLDQIFEVGPETGGRFVALGGSVDPQRRTVPLIFELPNPGNHLRIGMFAQVSVLIGDAVSGTSVPFSAVVEEGGQSIAYVQASGENFERRVVRLGIRDGDRVQVLSGVEPGERVVTTGAYQVRLAGTSTSAPAHGHEH